ncbi:MAG: prephenate dehydrogenase [Rhodothermales bacterium]|nr:prephenate dehydrogenase [Rhodothermales bacterium]
MPSSGPRTHTFTVRRVAVVGTGLMGGSLGLAIRRARPDIDVTGFDQPSVLAEALQRGAITRSASSIGECVRGADVVIFAAPIAATLRLLEEAAPHLDGVAVVTDLCSVKTPVLERAADVLPDGVLFVGGHPMTGSERTGIRHARELLYENATYVLCPPDPVPPEHAAALEGFENLLRAIGARLLRLDARAHDESVAHVSHLPQLLAVLLVNQAGGESERLDAVFELAAGGFRDMTRIAGSSFSIWRDIVAGNRGPILDALGAYAARLQAVRNRLAEDDWEAVGALFADAEEIRQRIPAAETGALRTIVDIFVFVPDETGALHRIISLLATSGLDIRDIELLKLREGTGGTFRLGFDTPRNADRAVDVLTSDGIQAYRLN